MSSQPEHNADNNLPAALMGEINQNSSTTEEALHNTTGIKAPVTPKPRARRGATARKSSNSSAKGKGSASGARRLGNAMSIDREVNSMNNDNLARQSQTGEDLLENSPEPKRKARKILTRNGVVTPAKVTESGATNASMMDKASGIMVNAKNKVNEGSDDETDEEEYHSDDYEDVTDDDAPVIKQEKGASAPIVGPTPTGNRVYRLDPNRPLAPNGRAPGRKLVMWHRPRMNEKLLLHVQYECHRRGIQIPWDHVVHRLNPGSSGSTALQHLNKLRDRLVVEGHLVPPLLGKVNVSQDPSIRGYIRDMNEDAPYKVRVVKWDEPHEDPKESIVPDGIVYGSGKKQKGMPGQGMDRLTKAPFGVRRSRYPAEVQARIQQNQIDRGPRKISVRKRAAWQSVDKGINRERSASATSDHLQAPAAKRRRVSAPRKSRRADDDDDYEEHVTRRRAEFERAIQGIQVGPRRNSLVLNLAPNVLSNFPLGAHVGERQIDDTFHPDPSTTTPTKRGTGTHSNPTRSARRSVRSRYREPSDEEEDTSDDSDATTSDGYVGQQKEEAAHEQDQSSSLPAISRPRLKRKTREEELRSSYRGVNDHGTFEEYTEAINSRKDPKLNGRSYLLQHEQADRDAASRTAEVAETQTMSFGGYRTADRIVDQNLEDPSWIHNTWDIPSADNANGWQDAEATEALFKEYGFKRDLDINRAFMPNNSFPSINNSQANGTVPVIELLQGSNGRTSRFNATHQEIRNVVEDHFVMPDDEEDLTPPGGFIARAVPIINVRHQRLVTIRASEVSARTCGQRARSASDGNVPAPPPSSPQLNPLTVSSIRANERQIAAANGGDDNEERVQPIGSAGFSDDDVSTLRASSDLDGLGDLNLNDPVLVGSTSSGQTLVGNGIVRGFAPAVRGLSSRIPNRQIVREVTVRANNRNRRRSAPDFDIWSDSNSDYSLAALYNNFEEERNNENIPPATPSVMSEDDPEHDDDYHSHRAELQDRLRAVARQVYDQPQ